MPAPLTYPLDGTVALERSTVPAGFVHAPPLRRLYPGVRETSARNWLPLPRKGRQVARPVVLFGACDRHNLGDLLMPLLLGRLLGEDETRTVAGLRRADLTGDGGLRVESYADLRQGWQSEAAPRVVLHFGGETLGCGLADAYAMTLDAAGRARFAERRERDSRQALEEARQATGRSGRFAYLARREDFPTGSALVYHAVGLAQPQALSAGARKALLQHLEGAEFLGVRDEQGARFLEDAGLKVTRMPCGVTALPWVCGEELAAASHGPKLAGLRERFPQGWIAVQISAYRKKLYASTARAVGEAARARGLGVVFLAAGLAPGHDDPVALERLAKSLPEGRGHFLDSRQVWDLAAAITGAEMFCGTSLHGRILAMAAGIPRLNLAARFAKIESYCRLWEYPGLPVEAAPEELPRLLSEALDQDRARLRRHARWLAQRYGGALDALSRASGLRLGLPGQPLASPHPLEVRA